MLFNIKLGNWRYILRSVFQLALQKSTYPTRPRFHCSNLFTYKRFLTKIVIPVVPLIVIDTFSCYCMLSLINSVNKN